MKTLREMVRRAVWDMKRSWMRITKKTVSSNDYYEAHKYDNKKKLIKEITRAACAVNGNGIPSIPEEYYEKLRNTGRKKLLRALMALKVGESMKVLHGARKCS